MRVMKIGAALLVGLMVCSAVGKVHAVDKFDWEKNAFYSMSGAYFALKPDSALKIGDPVTVFGLGPAVSTATVLEILDVAPVKKIFDERGFAGVYDDKKLWDEIGWYWNYQGPDEPKNVGRLSAP